MSVLIPMKTPTAKVRDIFSLEKYGKESLTDYNPRASFQAWLSSVLLRQVESKKRNKMKGTQGTYVLTK